MTLNGPRSSGDFKGHSGRFCSGGVLDSLAESVPDDSVNSGWNLKEKNHYNKR
jgi:hypothetical protein